jgi:rhodanese-related sulfurtransferase
MAIQRLTPAELKVRLDAGEKLVLLDVREPGEVAVCVVAGSKAIPLGELMRRVGELDPSAATVCICHHGVRSANAASTL